MHTETGSHIQREPFRIPVWLGLCFFLAIAAFFLWQEHRAHILGALPYALLLLCPIIHLFMHRGHGDHAAGHTRRDEHTGHRSTKGAAS